MPNQRNISNFVSILIYGFFRPTANNGMGIGEIKVWQCHPDYGMGAIMENGRWLQVPVCRFRVAGSSK